jgi:hypothetical protein
VIDGEQLANQQEIIDRLEQLNIFEIPYFANWYFGDRADYTQIKHYVATLNYLRLLTIEFLRNL